MKLIFIALLLIFTCSIVKGVVLESKLVIGGLFSQVNNTDYNNVMGYDLMSKTLFNLENGTNGEVYTVHTDVNGNVYIGGAFTMAGSADTGPIAVWNKANSKWQSVQGLTSADFLVGSTVTGIDTDCNTTCTVFISGVFILTKDSNVALNLAYYKDSWMGIANNGSLIRTVTKTGSASNLHLFLGGEFTDGDNNKYSAAFYDLNGDSWVYATQPMNVTAALYDPNILPNSVIVAADGFSNDCSGLCEYNFVNNVWSNVGTYGSVSKFSLLKNKVDGGAPTVFAVGSSLTDVQSGTYNDSSTIAAYVSGSYPVTGNVVSALDVCQYPIGEKVSGCRPGTVAAGGSSFVFLYSPGQDAWTNVLDGISGTYQVNSVKFLSTSNQVTFSNCKFVGANSVKFEWSIDATNNQIYCRATIPNGAGWAALGFKSYDSSKMVSSTIYLGYTGNNVYETFATSNAKPSVLSPNYVSYSSYSIDADGNGILTFVRPITKPSDVSQSLYYEFAASKNDTAIMFASHPSSVPSSPSSYSKHTWAQGGVIIDPFTSSQCLTQCYGVDYNLATVCSGNGNCTANNTCQCKSGYIGNNCQTVYYQCNGVDYNSTTVCSGNGNCTSTNVCSCNSGYSGSNCETSTNVYCNNILSTSPSVCSGHGVCVSNNTCSCNSSWTDSDCSTAVSVNSNSTNSNTTNSNSTDTNSTNTNSTNTNSTNTNSTNTNSTNTNSTQNSNSTITCWGIASTSNLVCNAHGTCSANNVCTCNAGWTGTNCSIAVYTCSGKLSTDSSVCNAKGSCVANGVCSCSYGWTGTNCNINTCYGTNSTDPSVCSSHGTCTGVDTCFCSNGWTGSNCSQINSAVCFGKNASDSSVCSGNGVCKSAACNCNDGFIGSECAFYLNATVTPKSIVSLNSNIPLRVVVNSKISFKSVSYKWKQVAGPSITNLDQITVSGTSNPDLIIQGSTDSFSNGLTAGSFYSFMINITLVESSGSVYQGVKTLSFTTNRPPVISSYSLLNNNDSTVITSGIAGTTVFKLSVVATDPEENSITYAFGYLSSGVKVFFGSFSSSNFVTFKLPFTDGGKIRVFIAAKDSLGAVVEQQVSVNVTDPTVGLSDSQISSYVQNLVSNVATVADLTVASAFLNKVSNASVDNTNIRTALIDKLASTSSSADPTTVLDVLSKVTVTPKEITSSSSKVVLNILSNLTSTTFTSAMSIQVLDVTDNVISASTASSSNTDTIKSILASAAKGLATDLATGQSQIVSNDNLKMFVSKATVDSLATPNTSAIGVSNMNIPTDSLKSLLSGSGFDVSMPISIGVTVTPASVYSYLPTSLTSVIFMIDILDTSGSALSISNLAKPIEFEMTVTSVPTGKTPQCIYYDKTSKSMSTSGVETVVLSQTKVKCRVYHLTDFTTNTITTPSASPSTGTTVTPKVSAKKSTVVSSSERLYHTQGCFVVVVLMILGFLMM